MRKIIGPVLGLSVIILSSFYSKPSDRNFKSSPLKRGRADYAAAGVCYPTTISQTQASNDKSLEGTWQYAGDILNGKKEEATDDIIQQRKYTDTDYTAYFNEKDSLPQKYETGVYKLINDTCLETETWSGIPSKLLNITIHYHYTISNDTLILTGILPGGATTIDYWKKVK